jgi:phosphohistidine phosphatase
MKTLILMRHAKSSMDGKKQEDWERPLNKRGKKNAVTLAKALQEKGIVPEVILASAAVRSHQTAELLIEELKFRGDVHYLAHLYKGEVDSYLFEIKRLLDQEKCVLVIGHNPMLESFLQMVSAKVESLPTASLAFLNVPVESWKDFNFEITSQLVDFWKPKD